MGASNRKAGTYAMEFSEKLINLRRREGMSQEQLADRLGVTRQSVSKWESGAVMPELVKLIALSEMFGVSVDYLVKDWLEEPAEENWETASARLEQKVDDLTRSINGHIYRYDSKTRILGLPLVSVRIGFVRRHRMSRDDVARGVIAIGNAAIGVVSLGIISIGLISFGAIAVGLLALGIVSLGLGAFGVAALGYLAFGVSAIGVYAGGVCAAGTDIAVGVAAASANTAVGCDADAPHVLLWGGGLSREAVEAFLLEHHPDLWKPLLRFLGAVGANLQ